MISKVNCGAVFGVKGFMVEVEADITNGLPSFDIVGLPDSAVKESKERVRSAITNCKLHFPPKRIIINLAPAHMRKEGPSFDLPIAMAICQSLDYIPSTNDHFICGELALDGQIRPVSGILSMIDAAHQRGIENAIVPMENAPEATLIKGMTVYGARHMTELIHHFNGQPMKKVNFTQPMATDMVHSLDFQDVKGQHMVKRALEIAGVGAHNLLMIGPPGSGKTMMASRLPSILPSLTFAESLEVTKIYSVASQLNNQQAFIVDRPFRSPHHSSSATSLIGGGRIPMPGEISLAHKGVLFLDELPEFHKNALEALRQPMEDKKVTVARVAGSATYPADFMLIGAMNPCPCGYLGDNRCKCSGAMVNRYQQKISGPMVDRMDIHIELQPVPYEDLSNNHVGEPSISILERVQQARDRQMKRQGKTNGHLAPKEIALFCQTSPEAESMIKEAFQTLGLSARGYHKILKLARSIADLDRQETIKSIHVAEAIQYRLLDR